VVAVRVAALLAALGLLAGGCSFGGGAGGATSERTHRRAVAMASYETSADNGYRIVLRYPASWRRYGWQVVSSFTNSMAYLSTGREHAPCTTTQSNGGMEVTCRSPLDRLAPGGILVTWTGAGFPAAADHRPLGGLPGDLLRRPAGWVEKISIRTPAVCPGLDATRSVTAYFAKRSWAGEYFQMQACLRAPGVSRHTDQVLAMLREVRFRPASS
jgi:hypothetical protein